MFVRGKRALSLCFVFSAPEKCGSAANLLFYLKKKKKKHLACGSSELGEVVSSDQRGVRAWVNSGFLYS